MKKKKKSSQFSYREKALFLLLLFFIVGVFLHGKKNVSQPTKPVETTAKAQTATISQSMRVPILLYHYVENVTDERDTIRKSLSIYPHIFEEQIKTLLNGGYTFITAAQLGDAMDGKTVLPKKPIILTFDDGYRDFYTDVFPLLKKHHAQATVYIVVNFLDKPNYMFSSQVKEVAQSGLVEIGSHTLYHPNLKTQSQERIEEEVIESKKMLEEKFNIPVVSFAYPYGAFNQRAIEAVKKAGYTTAVSTFPGIVINQENRYAVFRIRPGGRTGNTLLNYLAKDVFSEY